MWFPRKYPNSRKSEVWNHMGTKRGKRNSCFDPDLFPFLSRENQTGTIRELIGTKAGNFCCTGKYIWIEIALEWIFVSWNTQNLILNIWNQMYRKHIGIQLCIENDLRVLHDIKSNLVYSDWNELKVHFDSSCMEKNSISISRQKFFWIGWIHFNSYRLNFNPIQSIWIHKKFHFIAF